VKDFTPDVTQPVPAAQSLIFALLATDPQEKPAVFISNMAEMKEQTHGDWCFKAAYPFFYSGIPGLVLVIDANQFDRQPGRLFDGLWRYLSRAPGIKLAMQTDDVQYIEEVFNWVCQHEPNVQVDISKSFAQRMPEVTVEDVASHAMNLARVEKIEEEYWRQQLGLDCPVTVIGDDQKEEGQDND